MSSGQTKNAALTTALAFHYQVLIGLDKCFSLEEDQSVWFEKDGDVSLISPDFLSSTQTEVKDYSAPLTDHHENLWKTLKTGWLLSLTTNNMVFWFCIQLRLMALLPG
ncbi:hypothetical protein [Marinobacter shengliensis]|uniref:hypothetical protein n=1 Tax=Marinobacter shengliensis TaxID=1389223 RepID=UPI001E4E9ABA|nr:hypothetical protein [Marinobacter shengliensis]